MERNIIYRADLTEDLTPAQVDQNFRGIDKDLKALEGKGGGRDQVGVVTPVLGAGETGFLEMPLGKSYVILVIAANGSARIRVYQTAAHRAADAARPAGQAPANDHGMVAEAITAAGILTVKFIDCPFGANLEDAPTSTAYLSITNRDVVPRALSITITRLVLEA